MLRNIIRLTAPSTHPARRVDIAAIITGAVVVPVVPAAVASLTATAGTARIDLAWAAVTGAVSYDVETGAAATGPFTALSSAGETSYADLSASSAAITYYRVRARNAVGAGAYSPVASATAVAAVVAVAGAVTLAAVPTNLRSLPGWDTATNAGTDNLQWDGVPGATSYKIYLGDLLVATMTGASGNPPLTTYRNLTPRQYGLLYTVTAVTTQGESILSTNSLCNLAFSPGSPPSWVNLTAIPAQVKFVLAEPQWNAGGPRVLVRWGGGGSSGSPFNVYRDGILVATGLSACLYIDSAITAGQAHSYAVTAVNYFASPMLEGPMSSPSAATAPTGPPALSATPIPITRTVSRDDGVFVFFNHVAGAKDYICYKDNAAVAPEVALKNGKAAGEYRYTPQHPEDTPAEPNEMCIQMNDLDTVNPTTLRLAAVDKLARFQKQDGMMTGMGAIAGGPAVPNMNNDGVAQVNGPLAVDGFIKNGQGDPSNVPNIVALSAPFAVSCSPFVFLGTDGHGGQPFFDRFRTGINEPIVAAPVGADLASYASQDPLLVIGNRDLQRYLTPNWSFTNYGVDNANTKVFFMPHLMTTVYDGGGPGGPFAFGRPTAANWGLHIANTSLTLQPRENDPASPNFGQNKYFSIAGGKTLHMTMEVDAHVNGRRFVLMMLKGRGQTLYTGAPTKMHPEVMTPDNRATTDANLFAVDINSDYINLIVFQSNGSTTSRPYDPVDVQQIVDFGDAQQLARTRYPNPYLNGTSRDLDKMHRFHLYISHTQFRVVEEAPDPSQSLVFERNFPAGYVLPWDEMEPVFVHEVYHTGIDSLNGDEYTYSAAPGGPDNRHWIVNSPYRDERHWDNMGARVLDAFPVEPLGMQIDRTSIAAGTTVTVNVTIPPGNFPAGLFTLPGTTGSTVTSTTFVDGTHAAVTVHAGTAGTMAFRYEGPYIQRSLLLPVV